MASKLSKADYVKTSLRSYFLQNGFNYTNYQGNGYLFVLLPALKKLYKDDEEKLKEVAKANVEFYNTNPQLLPFITSMQLKMYENDRSIDETRNIKMALMGPLAGIGDSLAQFGAAPLLSTIFAGMALDGIGFAPIGFWTSIVIFFLIIKLLLGDLGERLGTAIIDNLSDKISIISEAAGIIGVTVISGLAASFTKVNLGIQYTQAIEGGGEQIVSLQEIVDQIAPALLPMLLTLLVFYLIKKRGWNTYQILLMLFVIGILGSVTGILV